MQVIIFQKELYAYHWTTTKKKNICILSSHRATRELYAKVPSHRAPVGTLCEGSMRIELRSELYAKGAICGSTAHVRFLRKYHKNFIKLFYQKGVRAGVGGIVLNLNVIFQIRTMLNTSGSVPIPLHRFEEESNGGFSNITYDHRPPPPHQHSTKSDTKKDRRVRKRVLYTLLGLIGLVAVVIPIVLLLVLLRKSDGEFSVNIEAEISEPPHDKTSKMTRAPSEDSDQPGHPPSLIRVFTVRLIGS